MPYIYLSLIISCLTITQSFYSMELSKDPLKKSSKKTLKKKDSKETKKNESPEKKFPKIPLITLSTNSSPNSTPPTSPRNTSPNKNTSPRVMENNSSPTTSPRNLENNTSPGNNSNLNKKLIKKQYTPPSSSLSNIRKRFGSSETIQPKLPKYPFIEAVNNNDWPTIIKFLDNKDDDIDLVNQPNEYGMTGLHRAVIDSINDETKNKVNLIVYLCKNYKIDSTIKTKGGTVPHQLLQGNENLSRTRQMLFARFSLEVLIYEEIFKHLYLNNCIAKEEDIKKIMDLVKNKIQNTQSQQGCAKLPENALFADYATDEFIITMINDRIQKQKNINHFITSLHQEIEILRLMIDTDTIMKEATPFAEKIMSQKKIKKILPHYITKEFLTHIIETYLVNERQKNTPQLAIIPSELQIIIEEKK